VGDGSEIVVPQAAAGRQAVAVDATRLSVNLTPIAEYELPESP